MEVSGDRELKVTEEGSEEVFGGCCFACLMYRKYLVQSVAEGDIPLALLFSDLFFRVGESEYFRENRLGAFFGSGGIEDRVFTNREPSNIEQQLIEENKTSSFIHTDRPSSPSHTYEPKRSQPIQKTHPKHYLRH